MGLFRRSRVSSSPLGLHDSLGKTMSGTMKASVIAGVLGALALCAVFVAVHQDTAVDSVREETGSVPESKFIEETLGMDKAKGKKFATPVKHEASLRKRIHTAIKVASKSLEKAHGKKEKAAAKAAVKAALADAGVADADNAATSLWPRSGPLAPSSATLRPSARCLPGPKVTV